MKLLHKSFALIGILFLSAQSSILASPTVSVPPFKSNVDDIPWWSKRTAVQLSDVLSTELTNSGLQVVERGNLDAVLSEQELADLGIVSKTARNNNTAIRGKMRGAQFIILGNVSSYNEGTQQSATNSSFGILGGSSSKGGYETNASVEVDLRVVNSTTGEVIAARTVSGTAKSTSKSKSGGFDAGALGSFLPDSGSKSAQTMKSIFGSIKQQSSSVEINKVPKEKAIRAALVSASDFVSCVLVVRGSCLAEFDAQERSRRSSLKGVLNFD